MMNEENIKKYLDSIEHEIKLLSPGFTGNIDFKLNFKDGVIANENITMSKSVKVE